MSLVIKDKSGNNFGGGAVQDGSEAEHAATGGFAVTPSDTVNFSRIARSLYVGVTGNIVVVAADNSVLTFVGVPAGSILPVQSKRVNSTLTTASSIVALY